MTTTRTISVRGFDVDVVTFVSGSCYMYPQFNHNAEFKATASGFRKLRRYLGTIMWVNAIAEELWGTEKEED